MGGEGNVTWCRVSYRCPTPARVVACDLFTRGASNWAGRDDTEGEGRGSVNQEIVDTENVSPV